MNTLTLGRRKRRPLPYEWDGALLPLTGELRGASAAVASAVARAAAGEGVAREPVDDYTIDEQVRAAMWQPDYPPVKAV